MRGKGVVSSMKEYKKEIEAELKQLLEELHKDFSSNEHSSVMQRVMYGLEIHQIEQEIKNLEFERTQLQLTEARNKYAELYDFAPIAYITFDDQANIIELNLAAARLLDQPHSKILNQPISNWLSDSEYQKLLKHLYKVSCSNEKISIELKFSLNDGVERSFHLESSSVRHDGLVAKCRTAMLDITDHSFIEEELKDSKKELENRVDDRTRELKNTNQILHEKIIEHAAVSEKLKLASIVFNNTEDGIIIMDSSFNIINTNKAFNKVTGYSSAELLNKNPNDLFTSRTDDEQFKNMQNALVEKGHWKGEVWYRCKDGSQIPIWENINEVKDDDGIITHYVAIATDITSLKETEMRLDHLAHHDSLTGLPNRLNYTANLQQAIKRAQRRGLRFALILLDLDNFKTINDTFGHSHGDTFLKIISERLQDCMRQEDTVARLGGDEFAIVLENIATLEDAGFIADKVLQAVNKPIEIERKEITPSASIGISIYPDDASDGDDLLKSADAAMYRAKETGGNKYHYFTSELTIHTIEKVSLENELRIALKEEQFEVYYQPQVALSNAAIVGMEALVRWNHPEKGLLKPDKFIDIAKDSGIINEIDEWVLNTACKQLKSWQDAGLPPIRVAVNIAERTLLHDNKVVDKVQKALESAQLDPSFLELEIPEKILKTTKQSIKMLIELSALGVHLSIDDFGTGFSSISSLKQLPIETIKIDRSFVCDVTSNPNDAALASAIIAMGHNLKIKVTAEGVSTPEQLQFLRGQGCDEMQGYLFSKPMAFEQAQLYLEKGVFH